MDAEIIEVARIADSAVKVGSIAHLSEYLDLSVDEPSESGKTRRFSILSRSHGYVLGKVRWYGGWRQYVFTPVFDDTIFNCACLSTLADLLRALNTDHSKRTKAQRQEA